MFRVGRVVQVARVGSWCLGLYILEEVGSGVKPCDYL